jgi:thiol-disulfide isomerase/thioredoxin
MDIYKRGFLFTGAGLALPGALLHAENEKADVPSVGSLLQLQALPLLSGEVLNPQQLKGQWLVLYYWASWCPFCAQQTPEMQKLHEKVRNNGMTVLGISIDKQLQNGKIHFQKNGYNFHSIWLSPELKIVIYKPSTIPTTLIFNPQEKLMQVEKGQMFSEEIENLSKYVM